MQGPASPLGACGARTSGRALAGRGGHSRCLAARRKRASWFAASSGNVGAGGRGSVLRMTSRPDVTARLPGATASVRVARLPAGAREDDLVAVEEPLEIRVEGEPVAV